MQGRPEGAWPAGGAAAVYLAATAGPGCQPATAAAINCNKRSRPRCASGGSSRSPMARLSDDVLLAVLQKLEGPRDRQAWCLVCKSFRDLEASVRRRVRLVKLERLVPVLRRFPGLEHLDLSLTQKVTDESLALVAEHAGPQLRCLNLSGVCGFSEHGLFQLARACPSLAELDLSHSRDLADRVLLAVSQMTNVRVLNLLGCRKVTDMGLGCVAAGCSTLEVLNLKHCGKVTDTGLGMVASCCRNLRSLDLSFTEVSNQGLETISTLTNLCSLHLVGCTNIDDEGLVSLKTNCKCLQNFDISNCPMVTDVGLMSLAHGNVECLRQLALSHLVHTSEDLLASFQKFTNLQSVRLGGCEVSTEGLAFLGRGCKDLQQLSLAKCIGVTDEAIRAVVSGRGSLQVLDLTCCRDITDLALAHIATTCEELRVLRMESCSQITDSGLALLALGCPMLEELDLTDTSITDEGIKSVSSFSSLRLLKLGICLSITNSGLGYIGACCSCLQEIDLYRAPGVGDAGIEALANGCPRLEAINLSYCSRITDNAMRSLSQLTALRQIEIRACPLVTSAGFALLSAGCKSLVNFDFKHCTGVGDDGISALVRGCPSIQQINASNSLIGNVGLLALANLSCLLTLNILHLKNVSFDCYEKVLLACTSLKKVKLLHQISEVVPRHVIEAVDIRGCRIRWMVKPDVAHEYFGQWQL